MIKDFLLAILLGALLSFGATGGYYSLKNYQTKSVTLGQTQELLPSPTIVDDQDSEVTSQDASNGTNSSHTLSITSPENETLLDTPVTDIKGSTSPNSTVILQTPKKSFTQQSDKLGNFTFSKIELEGGVNFIQISSVDQNDNQVDYELLLTYSSAKI
jgi:hypothetical protein